MEPRKTWQPSSATLFAAKPTARLGRRRSGEGHQVSGRRCGLRLRWAQGDDEPSKEDSCAAWGWLYWCYMPPTTGYSQEYGGRGFDRLCYYSLDGFLRYWNGDDHGRAATLKHFDEVSRLNETRQPAPTGFGTPLGAWIYKCVCDKGIILGCYSGFSNKNIIAASTVGTFTIC